MNLHSGRCHLPQNPERSEAAEHGSTEATKHGSSEATFPAKSSTAAGAMCAPNEAGPETGRGPAPNTQ
jgi:hypothetical protein